jgi:hypothetical protein
MALALSAAPHNERVASRAEAILEKQGRLADERIVLTRLQSEDLRREDRLRHWSLRVRHSSDVMKVTFEIAAALTALAVIAIIAAALDLSSADKVALSNWMKFHG